MAVVRATTEEIHGSTSAKQPYRRLPGVRMPHGFNGDIGATTFRQIPNLLNGFVRFARDQQFVRAHVRRPGELRFAASDGDHSRAVGFGQPDEHQADWTESYYGYVVSLGDGSLIQAAQHASQRFYQRQIG